MLPPPDLYLRNVLARLRLVALGGASLTLPMVACSPPTCEDPVRDAREFAITRDAAGQLIPVTAPPGTSYASCRALCDEAPAVLEVHGCEIVARAGTGDGGTELGVRCTGLWASCSNHYALGSGRRPEGYVEERFGSILVEMARLEGASAVAFERLAAELACHGAPPDLVAAARAAVNEELVHERLIRDLARAHGETCEPYAGAAGPARSVFAMALENAREGVVHEAFGALLNGLQAHGAPDAGVRALFAHLADDEVRHAALSLGVHRWASSRLGVPARARLGREIVAARDAIAARCGPDPLRGRLLGHPSRDAQLTLLASLDAEVLQLCA